jgi:inorganic pyrophosphatase/exopolyphosphatase
VWPPLPPLWQIEKTPQKQQSGHNLAVQPVYVSGHRNPDLDSIGSAVGYAELKARLDPSTEFVPVRLGDLNPQTSWVLGRAKADAPEYLQHIRLRAVDLMATEFLCVRESDAIREAGVAIDTADYDLVPVIDAEGKLAGVITTRALARRYVRESDESTAESLAAPCHELMEEAEVAVIAEDSITDVSDQLKNSHQATAIIVDQLHRPTGLLNRSDLVSPVRRRVVLVDHAEQAQAVPGIEQAEIVEILDHHHIGSIETRLPVKATFDPVGSTATLVVERFRRSGIEPSRSSATLLLGAVLSDTVILESPTTTDRDAAVVEYLERVLELDGRQFGREMFTASSDVEGVSASDLVRRDAKGYKSGNGTPFLVAQIEVVGKGLLERKEELLEAMRHELVTQGAALYALMITDILDKDTELLVSGDIGAAARAFGVEPSNGGHSLTLPGVMSRKKQVAPKLLATL